MKNSPRPLRDPAAIALSALLKGCPIQLPGYPMPFVYQGAGSIVTLPLGTFELESPELLYRIQGEPERYIGGADISLNEFIRAANEAKETDILSWVAASGLSTLNKDRRRPWREDIGSDLAPESDAVRPSSVGQPASRVD